MNSSSAAFHRPAILVFAVALILSCHAVAGAVLLVPDISGNIYQITSNGQKSVYTFVLGVPTGLAFDSSGNLYVTDQSDHNAVYKITPSGVRTTFASGLNSPQGIAIDASGSVYVADHFSGNIYKFTTTGVRSTFASGLIGPSDIKFDSAGNLFETEESGNLYKFGPTGARTTIATGMDLPSGIAFDSHGDMFVAEWGNGLSGSGKIDKFLPGGTRSVFAAGLDGPLGLAVDAADNLYEGNSLGGTVFKITPQGSVSGFASGFVYSLFLTFAPVPEPPSIFAFGVLVLIGLTFARRSTGS